MRAFRSILNLAVKEGLKGSDSGRSLKPNISSCGPWSQIVTRTYHKDNKFFAPNSPKTIQKDQEEFEEEKPTHLYK